MKLNKMFVALVAMLFCMAHSVSAQVAEVEGVSYASLKEAFAVADGKTVVLQSDLNLISETFTIEEGKSVTLDMNGKTITVEDTVTTAAKTWNYELFYIRDGELTVEGNGTITLTAIADRDWNAYSSIFHNRGGVLTIENGTFTHNGGTDMAYVIDNSGNHYGDAVTNISGGNFTSAYIVIRNRMEQNSHGKSGTAYLNISGGTFEGVRRTIWGQAASTNDSFPATGEINISGGEVKGLIETPKVNGAESMTTVTGGTIENFIGETGELKVTGEGTVTGTVTIYKVDGEGNSAEVESVVNDEGVYVQPVARVGSKKYTDFHEAVSQAVSTGNNVNVLTDVELTKRVLIEGDVAFTIQAGDPVEIKFVNPADEYGFVIKDQAKVTFAEGISIVGAGENICPLYIQTATVFSSANISTTPENLLPPIMTNVDYSATLTINGGEIVSGNSAVAGIYWPSKGLLTVTGGTITGANAIYLKSGKLNIIGGEFHGVGVNNAYQYEANGYVPTGAALVVENVGGETGYDEIEAIRISNGTFISDNSDAVQSFTAGMTGVAAQTAFVYGGRFNTEISSDHLAENLVLQDNVDGTYSPISNPAFTYEAQIGEYKYTTLAAAIEAANASEPVKLLTNVTLTEVVELGVNGLVLDLSGYTVTANCKKAFEVHSNTTIKNGTIIAENRCVDTRTNVSLTLEALSLEATSLKHGNPQPITIGGSDHGTNVEMNNVNINAPLGYGIISFVKTSLTATNCNINAYGALYVKENNASDSEFTLTDCNLQALPPASSDPTNNFALIAIRANNVTVNVNRGSLNAEGVVSAFNFHGESNLGTVYAEGCTIEVAAGTTIEGDIILEAKQNFEANTIILPTEYSTYLKSEGFYLKDNSDDTVTPTKEVAFVDGDFAYTNTTDIEGLTISYKRTFKNHSVWNAMFLPFEVPASMLLDNYQIAEWTGMLYETDGDGTVTATGIELTKIKNEAAILQANHPYLIYPKTEAAKELEIALDDATLYGADENNAVVLSNEVMTCKIVGNYRTLQKEELVDEYGERGWVMSASGKLAHSSSAMKPFRFLLTRTWNPGVNVNLSSSAMRVVFRDSDEVTAIENVALNAGKENVVYDLQGRRVMKPTTRGIYIVNGKKVFVK